MRSEVETRNLSSNCSHGRSDRGVSFQSGLGLEIYLEIDVGEPILDIIA